MHISWRILTGTALAMALSSFAMADTVTTTSTLSSVATDITDDSVAITPFTPGSNGVPLGSTLDWFTVSFAETISGTVTLSNTGTKSGKVAGSIDTLTSLALFTTSGSDAFLMDPDPTYSTGSVTVAAKSTNGPNSYTANDSGSTAQDSTSGDLTLAQSAWDLYFTTLTNQISGATGGNGGASFTNNVSGTVTVTYDYSTSPEPATMVLFGSALVGLGLIRKRLSK